MTTWYYQSLGKSPVTKRLVRCDGLEELIIAADSELSAIAHGRPPSDKAELLRISDGLRKIYDGMPSGEQ